MKFIMFVMSDVAKAAEVAQAADKVAKTPGNKLLTQYVCQGKVFDDVPPNTVVAVGIHEIESNEVLSAVQWPMALAGATVWAVPVLEMPVAGVATEEKKYRK